MREIILHRLWITQKFLLRPLFTTRGEPLQILSAGRANRNSGPDFLFARVRMLDKIWSGHVEMHIKASDWYEHGHHRDVSYNTVILHVVWYADAAVKRQDGTVIPALALSQFLSKSDLPDKPGSLSLINDSGLICQGYLSRIGAGRYDPWIGELYDQRLQEKCL